MLGRTAALLMAMRARDQGKLGQDHLRKSLMELKILFFDPVEDPMLDPKSNVAEQLAPREIVKPASTQRTEFRQISVPRPFSPDKEIYAAEIALECPDVAKTRRQSRRRGTSAMAPGSDIQLPTSTLIGNPITPATTSERIKRA